MKIAKPSQNRVTLQRSPGPETLSIAPQPGPLIHPRWSACERLPLGQPQSGSTLEPWPHVALRQRSDCRRHRPSSPRSSLRQASDAADSQGAALACCQEKPCATSAQRSGLSRRWEPPRSYHRQGWVSSGSRNPSLESRTEPRLVGPEALWPGATPPVLSAALRQRRGWPLASRVFQTSARCGARPRVPRHKEWRAQGE